MREQDITARVTQAAARAAEEAPGVAFLRPGLAELVRGTALPYLTRTADRAPRTGGVRVRRQTGAGGAPERWRLELHLAVLGGHRALDVTRAVRTAVTRAVRTELAAVEDADASGTADASRAEVSVAVTVTDIA